MNVLKKLKLALLATSVMFFPKAGHTIKPEDQKPSAGPSRQSPRPEHERPVFNSILSADSSNIHSAAVAAGPSSSLDEPQDISSLLGSRDIKNTASIQDELRTLRATKSEKEATDIINAIRDNLIKKFITPLLTNGKHFIFHPQSYVDYNNSRSTDISFLSSKRQEANSSLQEIVTYALTLSKEQIETRSNAVENLIIQTGRFRNSQEGSPDKDLKIELDYWGKFIIPLIGNVLKLEANQIINRTNAIKDGSSSLLPSTEFSEPYGSLSYRYFSSIDVVESLMKLQTQDIVNRIGPMNTLLPSKDQSHARIFWTNEMTKAASFLSTDELKSCAEKSSSILNTSPGLMPMATQLGYLSLKLRPADFDAVVSLVRGHQDILVPWLSAQEFNSPVFDYSLDKIYATANQVYNKNYFLTDFMPKVEAKFKELNGFSLEDDTILKTFFPSLAYARPSQDRALFPPTYSAPSSRYSFSPETLANFSRDNLQNTIAQVGPVYMNLFQPTSFPEFQPSADIESGPSSSSGPMLEPAPSSSRAIHSAPTTFRTTGANENAEIKHSAIYASFPYQNKPDAAYSLIINHRTKAKGSEVRVFNPNTKTYIDLGRLSPSMGFSDQVFSLSSLFASTPSNSSGPSIMKTELNFIDGISDIHSFTIKSGEERLMEVILGDQDSEKQTGVHVYAPELSGNRQEWSKASAEGVEE